MVPAMNDPTNPNSHQRCIATNKALEAVYVFTSHCTARGVVASIPYSKSHQIPVRGPSSGTPERMGRGVSNLLHKIAITGIRQLSAPAGWCTEGTDSISLWWIWVCFTTTQCIQCSALKCFLHGLDRWACGSTWKCKIATLVYLPAEKTNANRRLNFVLHR